jgi:hypothetical protein
MTGSHECRTAARRYLPSTVGERITTAYSTAGWGAYERCWVSDRADRWKLIPTFGSTGFDDRQSERGARS